MNEFLAAYFTTTPLANLHLNYKYKKGGIMMLPIKYSFTTRGELPAYSGNFL